jgi:hypothetical protein
MPEKIANDGEVGLVYRMGGRYYAVVLTAEQHELLQQVVPVLGKIAVDKNREVDYVKPKASEF